MEMMNQRTRHYFLFSSLLMLYLMSSMQEAKANKLESWRTCCGAVCLRTVTGLLGDDVDLARIRELVKPNTLGEVSLDTIARSANEMGYCASGLSLHRDLLEKVTVPLIAHDPPNHFVVILGLGKGNGAIVIDPPQKPRKISFEELSYREYWNVVAISKVPFSSRGLNRIKSDIEKKTHEKSVDFGVLRFVNPMWDFGNADPNIVMEHDYSFFNMGKEPVEVTKVKSSCSCLKVLHFTENILPGENGHIEVSVDPSGMQGFMSKKIIGFLKEKNSEELQPFILNVSGELSRRGEIVFRPQKTSFHDLIKGEKISKTVTIQRLGYSPLELESVVSDSPYVKAKVINSSIPDPYKAEVELQIDTSAVPIGYFESKVFFKTNQQNCQNTATLEMSGNVISHISSEPSELYLGLIKPNEQFEKTITLFSQKNNSFKAVNATTNIDQVTASIASEVSFGSQTEWEIALAGNVQETGLLEGILKIEIDGADISEIEIPFTGFVKD